MPRITIPSELEHALSERAREQGTTLDVLVEEALRRIAWENAPTHKVTTGRTMEDFLDPFIGVIHSSELVPGGGRMSEMTGADFAQDRARRHTTDVPG